MNGSSPIYQYRQKIRVLDASRVSGRETLPSVSQYAKQGVQGYLIDRVKGDPLIINALCQVTQLHRVTIGTDEVYDKAFSYGENPQFYYEASDGKRHHRFASMCYTPKGYVCLKYSIYGNKSLSVSRVGFKYFGRIRAGDTEGKLRLEEERDNLREEAAKLKDDAERVEQQYVELNRKKQQIMAERNELREKKQGSAGLINKLTQIQRILEGLRRKPSSEAQKERIKNDMKRIVVDRVENFKNTVEIARQVTVARRMAFMDEIRTSTLYERVRTLENEVSQLKRDRDEANHSASTLKREVDQATAEFLKAKAECPELTPADKESFQYLPFTVPELQAEIQMREAESERLGVANDRKREYDSIKERLDTLQAKIGSGSDVMKEHELKLDKLKVFFCLVLQCHICRFVLVHG
jgi:hypothetical protein